MQKMQISHAAASKAIGLKGRDFSCAAEGKKN
jgi:hypothetical protein